MTFPSPQATVRTSGNMMTVSVTKALAAAGDYAANDVLSESASAGTVWTFGSVVRANGGSGTIVKAIALLETTALTPGITLFLFSVAPTSALNDNVANTAVLHADQANFIGRITFPAMADLGTGDSEALATPSLATGNLPLAFNVASGDRAIYGIAVTRDAITGEVATDELIIKLTIERD
ncbi:MAG: hypothetical protein IIC82_06100 [Chloroflexi bacterium]|nr:hypothetical protein [Chloroflexota bacterium]